MRDRRDDRSKGLTSKNILNKWVSVSLLLACSSIALVNHSSRTFGSKESEEAKIELQLPAGIDVEPTEGLIYDPDAKPFAIPARYTAMRAPQTATFDIDFQPAALCGENGAEWPEDAKAAVEYAGQLWGSLIVSDVPIKVSACWTEFSQSGLLGYASSVISAADFPNAPMSGIQYPIPLANALAGYDLAPTLYDIQTTYNANFPYWYFGTDGQTGGLTDFVTVVMHELGHGLGFAGTSNIDSDTGFGTLNNPGAPYDIFVRTGGNQAITDILNPSAQLATALTSNDLYFDGPFVRSENGGAPAPIYAPSTYARGSSFSHLNTATYRYTANGLMVHALGGGQVLHDPGPVGLSVFKDIGWRLSDDAIPTATPTLIPTNTPTHTATPTETPFLTETATPTETIIPTATSTPVKPAAESEFIYEDAIADGWTLGNWGLVSTKDPSSTDQVLDGEHALKLVFGNAFSSAYFQALQPFDTATYDSISFDLYGEEAEQSITFELLTSNFSSLGSQTVSIDANQWKYASVDFSLFEPSEEVKYILIRNVTSGLPIYIDNLSLDTLIGGEPINTPTPFPTATLRPGETPSPTSTPTATPMSGANPSFPSGAKIVYADEVQNGWSSGALGSVTIDEQSTKQILAGDFAIEAVYSNSFSRFYLRADTPLEVVDVEKLFLSLYAPNRSIKVSLMTDNFQSTIKSVDATATGLDWVPIEINLSSISDLESIAYVMIEFTDNEGGALFLDNVFTVGKASDGAGESDSNVAYLPYVSK